MHLGTLHFPEEVHFYEYTPESPAKFLDVVLITPSPTSPRGKPSAYWLVLDLYGPITMSRALAFPNSLDHTGSTSGAGGE